MGKSIYLIYMIMMPNVIVYCIDIYAEDGMFTFLLVLMDRTYIYFITQLYLTMWDSIRTVYWSL